MKHVFRIIILAIVAYLIGCFWMADFNIKHWVVEARIGASIVWIVFIGIYSGIILEDELSEPSSGNPAIDIIVAVNKHKEKKRMNVKACVKDGGN